MTISTETLALAIGARVRQERQVRQWTLDHLATTAGISRRMLTNVEQGAVNPSVGTLLQLSNALGVGLPDLVEPPAPKPVKLTPRGEGAALWTGPEGGRGTLVAATEPPNVLELWDWTLLPGERHESEAHVEGTRELMQVLDGRLVVEVDGEAHPLAEGDALTFAGSVAHAYANTSEHPARFTLTVFEPGVGTTHRSEEATDD